MSFLDKNTFDADALMNGCESGNEHYTNHKPINYQMQTM